MAITRSSVLTPAELRERVAKLPRIRGFALTPTPLMVESDFCVHDEYVGAEYGDAPPATLEAIRLAARVEGVFLDPVYTGKAFSGLMGEIRKGETVVFVHTGGPPIIFAYDEVLARL